MKPESITGNRNRGVIFQDSGFEAGMAHYHNSIWPYCSWIEDGKSKAVGYLDIESWDQLLMKLVDEKPEAAKWLICKCITLNEPKETILALVNAGIIEADAAEEQISVPLLPSRRLSAITDLLKFYGWQPLSMGAGPRTDRKFMFPE